MSKPKIKQGDIVVCNRVEGTLELGQKYLVQAVDGNRVSLNHVSGWYLSGLFSKSDDPSSDADKFRARKSAWYRGNRP